MNECSNKRRENLSNVLFGTTKDISVNSEQVRMISLNDLHAFKGHPFKVLDDAKMQETVESISRYGVLVPGIARPRKSGGYEIIAGHQRKRGSELAGKKEVPFLIRNYSDDEATIIMVDSNIQREDILPSEKAFAYQMKNEALKHQGKKNEKSTYELVGEKAGDNAKTVQRYIRLTKLIPQLLELVDTKKLGFIAGAELSFLNESEQGSVYQWMQQTGKGINVNQAESLKKYSQVGMFDDCFKRIFLETLAKKRDFQLKAKWRNEFFEESKSDEEIEIIIYNLLCEWKQKRG